MSTGVCQGIPYCDRPDVQKKKQNLVQACKRKWGKLPPGHDSIAYTVQTSIQDIKNASDFRARLQTAGLAPTKVDVCGYFFESTSLEGQPGHLSSHYRMGCNVDGGIKEASAEVVGKLDSNDLHFRMFEFFEISRLAFEEADTIQQELRERGYVAKDADDLLWDHPAFQEDEESGVKLEEDGGDCGKLKMKLEEDGNDEIGEGEVKREVELW
eukprot:CAMPEP_0197659208 /NCGR_PEP_ID=MMETSP1338-20131121/46659_1 /TAXON_ID=43686 ORGANISM="Pelagodinium beii, Strain RCC1491" /NCGR_SAMPLE_ID=MMETSP1338 /ASSEMBLY_ACC=CAM_ASM_000754 /LENGTH=211 /DNA_ID=CAMNT_0043236021 /DNA_START=89 /DNA_END=721 /DNA_ORIENTATION=+